MRALCNKPDFLCYPLTGIALLALYPPETISQGYVQLQKGEMDSSLILIYAGHSVKGDC